MSTSSSLHPSRPSVLSTIGSFYDSLSTTPSLTSTPSDHELCIAYYNINSITHEKLDLCLSRMISLHLDILILIDTRQWRHHHLQRYRQQCLDRLGPGASFHCAASLPHRHPHPGRPDIVTAVGGQFIIKSPRLPAFTSHQTDPTNTGSLSWLTLHMGLADLLILGAYIPVPNSSTTGSLHSKVSSATIRQGSSRDPHTYLQDVIHKSLRRHHRAQHTGTIIGGDFNAAWSPSDPQGTLPPISDWVSSASLLSPYDTLGSPREPTHYQGERPVNCIDHILYHGTVLTPTGVLTDTSTGWGPSDHRPIIASFTINGWDQPYLPRALRKAPPPSPPPDVPRRPRTAADHRRFADFQQFLQQRFPSPSSPFSSTLSTSQSFVTSLSRACAIAAKRPRRRRQDDWNPSLAALLINHSTLQELHRHLFGYRHRTRWLTAQEVSRGLHALLTLWRHKVRALSLSSSQYRDLLQISGKGPDYWNEAPLSTLRAATPLELKRLGKLLQGSRRAALREIFRKQASHHSDLRDSGRITSLTKRYLDRLPAHYDLTSLTDPTTQHIHTDGRTIAQQLTSHFERWHAPKPLQYGFHVNTQPHDSLLADYATFQTAHSSTGIPAHLLRCIWEAMVRPLAKLADPTSTILQDQSALLSTPSFEEFCTHLSQTPIRSAAGPSGLTYNMLAALPDSLRLHLYHHLVHLWTHGQGTPAWKWRLLRPIPKKADNVTLNDLRPITLIETTRKVWVGIFTSRIKTFLHKHDLLHHSQHAYSRNRGTDTVHPQLRNLLEECQEECTSLYGATWDITKAFDRVPKPVLRMAWRRVGIPPLLADYLVDFDDGGFTIISTPYTRSILHAKGIKGFSTCHTHKAPCFQAITGTGQGDIPSPINWNCFFDVLLWALDFITHSPFYFRGQDSKLVRAQDTGYADDLLSVSARLSGLQAKADVVSAFCIIFGLDIAVAKVRTLYLQWGHEDTKESSQPKLTVHVLPHWSHTTTISFSSPSSNPQPIKYLGLYYDYYHADRSHFDRMVASTHHDFQLLLTKRGRSEDKIQIAIAGILSRLRFVGKYTSWSLRQLHALDSTCATYYRKLLRLTPSFSTDLLYGPASHGCMDLPRLSDLINQDKLNLIARGLRSKPATRHSIHGLLNRGIRYSNQRATPTSVVHLLPTNNRHAPLWIESLVDWLALADLRLSSGGPHSPDPLDISLTSHFLSYDWSPPLPLLDHLNSLSINTLRDVTYFHTPTRQFQWIMDRQLWPHGPPPAQCTQSLPYPSTPPALEPRQCWLIGTDSWVTEIIGFTSSSPLRISVRRWLTKSTRRMLSPRLAARPQITPGSFLALDPATHSYGAGTPLTLPYSVLFPEGTDVQRIILSPERPLARTRGIFCEVLHIRPTLRPQPPRFHPPTQFLRHLPGALRLQQYQDLLQQSTIFTDASFRSTAHPITAYFHRGPPGSLTGAVVLQPPNAIGLHHNTLAIRVHGDDSLPTPSSFLGELLMVLLAVKIRAVSASRTATIHPTVHTDCQGVLRMLTSTRIPIWKRPSYHLINHICRTSSDTLNISWVPSHTDRRKAFSNRTYLEHGNVLADSLASPRPPARHPTHIPTFNITVRQLLTNILEDSQWVVTHNGLPIVESPISLVQHARHLAYVHRRDLSRSTQSPDPSPIKWIHLTLQNAGAWHQCERASIPQRARITRLIYDWVYHGTKAVQGSKHRYPEPLPCPLCHEPDSQFHMICGCDHPAIAAIRTQAMSEISSYLHTLDLASPSHLAGSTIRDMADTAHTTFPACLRNPHYIWIGTWTTDQLLHLENVLGTVAPSATPRLYSTITRIGRVLARASIAIINQRHVSHMSLQRARRLLYRRPTSMPPQPTSSRSLPSRAHDHDHRLSFRKILRPLRRSAPTRPLKQKHISDPLQTRITSFFTTSTTAPPARERPTATHSSPSKSTAPSRTSPSSILSSYDMPLFSSTGLGIIPHLSDPPWLDAAPQGPPDDVKISFSGDRQYWPLTAADFRRLLDPQGWLNDVLIDNFGTFLSSLSPHPPHSSSFLFLSSHLYSSITSQHTYIPNRDLPWFRVTRANHCINPLLYNILLIPINDSNTHWTGIFVDLLQHTITYRDPLGHPLLHQMQVLQHFLADELSWRLDLHRHDPTDPRSIHPDRAAILGDPRSWTTLTNPSPNPLQDNRNDCGMYFLLNALSHIPSLSAPPFQPCDIPLARTQTALAFRHLHITLTSHNLVQTNDPLTPAHLLLPVPVLLPPSSSSHSNTYWDSLLLYSRTHWPTILPLLTLPRGPPPPRAGIG